ncbi:unnamed protein product [Sphagnum balticum]
MPCWPLTTHSVRASQFHIHFFPVMGRALSYGLELLGTGRQPLNDTAFMADIDRLVRASTAVRTTACVHLEEEPYRVLGLLTCCRPRVRTAPRSRRGRSTAIGRT